MKVNSETLRVDPRHNLPLDLTGGHVDISLDIERSLAKCMVRVMDLTDGKSGAPLPWLETKNDKVKETLRK